MNRWEKTLAFLLALGVVFIVFVVLTTNDSHGAQHRCDPVLTKTAGAHKRAQRGWDSGQIKRRPSKIERVREQAGCVPDGKPEQFVRAQIHRAKHQYRHADDHLYDAITAAPGQSRLRVLRWCESGDRYNDPSAPAGAYGMLQGWSLAQSYYTAKDRRAFGKPTSPPYTAKPVIQDVLASLLYQHQGTSPWECPF